MTKVFYVNVQRPWRAIREVDATVIACKKQAWAEDQHGSRRLIGSTVFFTLAAAERAKIGALVKIVDKPSLFAALRLPHVHAAALKELQRYQEGYTPKPRRQFT